MGVRSRATAKELLGHPFLRDAHNPEVIGRLVSAPQRSGRLVSRLVLWMSEKSCQLDEGNVFLPCHLRDQHLNWHGGVSL